MLGNMTPKNRLLGAYPWLVQFSMYENSAEKLSDFPKVPISFWQIKLTHFFRRSEP